MTGSFVIDRSLPVPVINYLSKCSIPEWNVELSLEQKFNNIIVVPAIEEYNNIRRLLVSLAANEREYFAETLILFVINNTGAASDGAKKDNIKSLSLLREIIKGNKGDQINELLIQSGLRIGMIDAASEGRELPIKEGGVGLARKIGMDLALTLFDYGNSGKKIIICLDADCEVDANYLGAIIGEFNETNLAFAYVQYEHKLKGSEGDKLAIVCYELFLRYYVLGLKYAGSAYAFPTIGSTMACDYESYIGSGGMNKKKAAEDFYFMEKLAKRGAIGEINTTRVYPSGRGSWRVPFGTGQRVNRFAAGTENEYLLYNPGSFEILKMWLRLFNSGDVLSADQYLSSAAAIHPALSSFLVQNGFSGTWGKIVRNSKSGSQIEKQKKFWFDGFRTLKLIHYLRDNGLEQVGMFEAVDKLLAMMNLDPGIKRNEPVPPLNMQVEYLEYLRRISLK
jgi:glycosyltransferase involved in cell wall biosynthesis